MSQEKTAEKKLILHHCLFYKSWFFWLVSFVLNLYWEKFGMSWSKIEKIYKVIFLDLVIFVKFWYIFQHFWIYQDVRQFWVALNYGKNFTFKLYLSIFYSIDHSPISGNLRWFIISIFFRQSSNDWNIERDRNDSFPGSCYSIQNRSQLKEVSLVHSI